MDCKGYFDTRFFGLGTPCPRVSGSTVSDIPRATGLVSHVANVKLHNIMMGVVTSLGEEHENSASRIFSNDRDCLAPHVHSRRAKAGASLQGEVTLTLNVL
jgi:hypothetical protein